MKSSLKSITFSVAFLILLFGQSQAVLAELSDSEGNPASCGLDGMCRWSGCPAPDPDCPESNLPNNTSGNTTQPENSVGTRVSGISGSDFEIGDAESTTYALYGISSKERADNPCLVTALKEHINDSSKDSTSVKNLCGSNGATSSEIKANFSDSSVHGKRVFLTGVQVVMNNNKTRVKGFKIRGKKIDDAGNLIDLEDGCSDVFQQDGGGVENRICNITEPSDTRTNADKNAGWMSWAECPNNSLATAAVLHYEAGNTPRSLTGIALKCRDINDMQLAE